MICMLQAYHKKGASCRHEPSSMPGAAMVAAAIISKLTSLARPRPRSLSAAMLVRNAHSHDHCLRGSSTAAVTTRPNTPSSSIEFLPRTSEIDADFGRRSPTEFGSLSGKAVAERAGNLSGHPGHKVLERAHPQTHLQRPTTHRY